MSILTEEEIEVAQEAAFRSFRNIQGKIRGQMLGPQDSPDWHFARAIESAVLEKLAWMELPEPFGLFCGVRHDPPKTKEFWGMLNEGADNGSKCNLYTADQLRQAYAQGAASVLSAEPSGFISPHDLKMLKEGYPATVVMLLGAKRTQPLYTLKTIK